ncbi:Formamidopyrimidine-DNA glycosylase [Exophiala dermatitidis]
MPEIAEVARTVHYIRKHLVGKTLAKVVATDDNNVYGKAGTSAAEFEKAMTGKKVLDAGQQGKYFWMIMSSPPHPVMHFGMSGWLHFKSEHTYYYQPKGDKADKTNETEQTPWPPKFMKFMLETAKPDVVEAAFVDMRRFARIRLVDCPASQIRNVSPLKENGPDPVIDKETVTVDWLKQKCKSKKVPIKAMLLDQAVISGIGNWVGDEIMYNAKMHPEQYANTLTDDQIVQLHKSIHYICGTAVELLADSEKFPDDWLFRHRWGRGKKNSSNALPNGEKIAFLTVGGRTSAVVPSVQKKTGPVAKEMSEAQVLDGDDEVKKPKGNKRKAVTVKEEEESESEHSEEAVLPKKTARGRKSQRRDEPKQHIKPDMNGDTNKSGKVKAGKRVKKEEETAEEKSSGDRAKAVAPGVAANETGRRRSGRLAKP